MRINNKCTIILYYIVLYYIILYYIILCYIILYVNIVTKRKYSYEKQVQKIMKDLLRFLRWGTWLNSSFVDFLNQ